MEESRQTSLREQRGWKVNMPTPARAPPEDEPCGSSCACPRCSRLDLASRLDMEVLSRKLDDVIAKMDAQMEKLIAEGAELRQPVKLDIVLAKMDSQMEKLIADGAELRQSVKALDSTRTSAVRASNSSTITNVTTTTGPSHSPSRPSRPRIDSQESKAGEDKKMQQVETFSMVMIFLFSAFLGFEVQQRMNAALGDMDVPRWVWWVNLFFTVGYVLEVVVKLAILRGNFLGQELFMNERPSLNVLDWNSYSKENALAVGQYLQGFNFKGCQWWNIFDVVLVCSAIMDSIVEFFSLRVMRFFRVLRFARALKAVRAIGVFTDLRFMVASLVSAAPTLFWALVMLWILLYFCSLIIMDGVEEYILENGVDKAMLDSFGSLYATAISMFMSISGGVDWGDCVESLSKISAWYLPFFAIFVGIVTFCVVGVLTAVIIEASKGILSQDRDLVIEQVLRDEMEKKEHLKRLFCEEIDKKSAGVITDTQLERALTKPRIRAFLGAIDLGTSHTQTLFKVLDKNCDGELSMDEFVDGLMEHRGIIATIIDGNHRISNEISVLMYCLGYRGEEEGTPCECGNVFMQDSIFCRKCGGPRPRNAPDVAELLIATHAHQPEQVETSLGRE